MLTISSLYLHCKFALCSLYVYYMFTVCSLYVHCMFTDGSLKKSVHDIFKPLYIIKISEYDYHSKEFHNLKLLLFLSCSNFILLLSSPS